MLENVFLLLVFGTIGLGAEVIFTALSSLMKKEERDMVRLFGYSSLWYLPLYSIVLPLGIYFLQSPLGSMPLLVRGFLYALFMHIGEFIAMGILHVLNGKSPSEKEYLKSKHSIKGFTRWDFFPAFVLLGIAFEYLVLNILVG